MPILVGISTARACAILSTNDLAREIRVRSENTGIDDSDVDAGSCIQETLGIDAIYAGRQRLHTCCYCGL